MDEIQIAEERLTKATAQWQRANEAVRKLTRMDTDKTINQTLHSAREARYRLAAAHKDFMDAYRWRLGR